MLRLGPREVPVKKRKDPCICYHPRRDTQRAGNRISSVAPMSPLAAGNSHSINTPSSAPALYMPAALVYGLPTCLCCRLKMPSVFLSITYSRHAEMGGKPIVGRAEELQLLQSELEALTAPVALIDEASSASGGRLVVIDGSHGAFRPQHMAHHTKKHILTPLRSIPTCSWIAQPCC